MIVISSCRFRINDDEFLSPPFLHLNVPLPEIGEELHDARHGSRVRLCLFGGSDHLRDRPTIDDEASEAFSA